MTQNAAAEVHSGDLCIVLLEPLRDYSFSFSVTFWKFLKVSCITPPGSTRVRRASRIMRVDVVHVSVCCCISLRQGAHHWAFQRGRIGSMWCRHKRSMLFLFPVKAPEAKGSQNKSISCRGPWGACYQNEPPRAQSPAHAQTFKWR